MSLSHEQYLLLSALADGELGDDEHEAAVALLAESADARTFTESLALLGQAVQAAGALEPAPSVELVDAIMARLPTEAAAGETLASPPAAQAAPVRSLAEARARRARASQFAVAVGALAIAAASLFYARARHEAPSVGPVALATPSAVEPVGAEKGVEVRAIDSDETSQVSVFYLPAGANMSSSVVVWIDDKGAP
ncbi:MAG TPA: hypothetical protein PLR99_25835 [Polyangiaceae bacterium]|nr:hypothetical protein [Polyangiaceae bacterium]